MRVELRTGKGGWIIKIDDRTEPHDDFYVFRADEARRLVQFLCKRALGVELDVILDERQAEIKAARAKIDGGNHE